MLQGYNVDIQYEWLVAKGLNLGKTTMTGMTDLSLADYASQKLGKQ